LLFAASLVSLVPARAQALEPVASFKYLVTGNGHGFQVYDVDANAITQYLERPYRFLRANPSNPDGDGIVRRNLVFDTYFGVRVGSQAAWLGTRDPSEVGYVAETNVIRSAVTIGGVKTETFFYAPFGYEGNAMVMLLRAENTSGAAQNVTAYSVHNFKLGTASNPDAPGANSEVIAFDSGSATATETGPGGGTMVYAPIGGSDGSSCDANAYNAVAAGNDPTPMASCNGTDRVNVFSKNLGTVAAGEVKWWGVAVLFDDGNGAAARTAWTTYLAGRSAQQLHDDALAEWDAWRKPPPDGLSADELAVWRQSESVLRMGQIREPYSESPRRKNHGMILASLPPGGWHTGWVRDMVYANVALARTGHWEEARFGLDFFLGADAGRYGSFLNNVEYRISTVRYYGDGEEEADYSGHPTRNIEIDGWGLFLWAARAYVDASEDVAWLSSTTRKGDTVYEAIRSGVAEPLAANLESSGMAIADASIWEVHWGNRQHWLYTTAATARGFCDMATLARRAGRMEDVERYRGMAERAVASMRSAFIDSNRVLAGSLEKLAQGSNYRDGATVEAFTWNLIPSNDPIATATLGEMSYLQTPAGGYKRLEGSNDQYDTDEWILIDLRASDAFRRAGNGEKADQLLGWVTGQASVNFDLLPELYNTRTSSGTIGAYSGSIPMVGYGAGAYQMTLLDRAGAFEPSDCGEVDVGEYPDAGPGGPGPENPGEGDARTGLACMCETGRGGAKTPWAELALFVGVVVIAVRPSTRRRSRSASLRTNG
jgi:GH15 family glucan-1,4-alpha-glucosidase